MKKYLLLLPCLALFGSCTTYPYLYKPNALNMPLLADKHDFKANAGIGTEGEYLQTAYAIRSHMVVLANGNISYLNQHIIHGIVDIGAGYFEKTGETGRMELIGSIGGGVTNDAITNNNYQYHGFILPSGRTYIGAQNLSIYSNMFRWSLQWDIGIAIQDFQFGYGMRLTDMYFNGNYKENNTDSAGKTTGENNISLKGNALLLEPGISLAFGVRNIRFVALAGLSYQLSGIKTDQKYGPLYFPFYLSAGININLFDHKAEKQQPSE